MDRDESAFELYKAFIVNHRYADEDAAATECAKRAYRLADLFAAEAKSQHEAADAAKAKTPAPTPGKTK